MNVLTMLVDRCSDLLKRVINIGTILNYLVTALHSGFSTLFDQAHEGSEFPSIQDDKNSNRNLQQGQTMAPEEL